ncbi:MAG: hypothetical protein BWK78_00900 [Thiotrichaceae bacterium IS1]|nr:MAG: hypothetical protein BWK78_00900 [Thiotrichaceae bacterium IS1]
MYQFVMSIKLGIVILFLSIVFVNGCSVTIKRPAPTTPAPDEPSPIISPTYHTVQHGETFQSIAQMYGINNYQDFMTWNRLSSPYVSPGQQLMVSPPSGPSSFMPPYSVPLYPSYNPQPIPYTPPPKKGKFQSPVVCGSGEYHTVKKGETLSRIAKACGRNLAELAAWNHLADPYPLSVGKSIRVKKPPTDKRLSRSTPASSVVSSSHYIVKHGDTLYDVASRYGQTVGDLARWNNLQPPYTLSTNQQVLIKPPGNKGNSIKASSVTEADVTENNTLFHSVSAGQTLYSISKMYGHSVEEVAAWNGLSFPYNLRVGQNLHVSSSVRKTTTSPKEKMISSKGKKAVKIPGGVIQHVVKDKETAYSIAKHYGITVFDLAIWNGIGKPYTIFPGQKLKIMK